MEDLVSKIEHIRAKQIALFLCITIIFLFFVLFFSFLLAAGPKTITKIIIFVCLFIFFFLYLKCVEKLNNIYYKKIFSNITTESMASKFSEFKMFEKISLNNIVFLESCLFQKGSKFKSICSLEASSSNYIYKSTFLETRYLFFKTKGLFWIEQRNPFNSNYKNDLLNNVFFIDKKSNQNAVLPPGAKKIETESIEFNNLYDAYFIGDRNPFINLTSKIIDKMIVFYTDLGISIHSNIISDKKYVYLRFNYKINIFNSFSENNLSSFKKCIDFLLGKEV